MKKGMRSNLEPFVIVILIAITIVEFLILAGGLKYQKFIESLIAMITLMIFGSTLLMISITARIHDLLRRLVLSNISIEAQSPKQQKTKTTTKKKKSSKKKKRR